MGLFVLGVFVSAAYVLMNYGVVAAGAVGVLGAGAFLFGLGKVKSGPYSVEVRPAKPGQSAPRRNIAYKDKLKICPAGITTLYDNFQSGLQKSPNGLCFCYRPDPNSGFVGETYTEVWARIKHFGSGLTHIGLKHEERVGFYAQNCREWALGAEACNAFNFVSVAIYDTLGEEHRPYIVDQSELVAIVTTKKHVKNVCDLKTNGEFSCGKLKYVVVIDKLTDEDKAQYAAVGLDAYSFAQVEEIGKNNQVEPIPPSPDDLAVIMYTSGTTSRPKGVMITHGNMAAVVQGIIDGIPAFNNSDRYLSYLPLAHILERAAEAAMISQGASIGFYQGDIRKLTDDIMNWKPTIYAGVPKVFQRVMNTVHTKIANEKPHVRFIFNAAFWLKLKFIQYGLSTALFDKTIFKKTKDGLGGQVKIIVSGGAPLAAECHQFLRVCFGPTVQGYGLTETCGGVSISPFGMPDPWEKAGAPLCCSEIKLVDAGKYSTKSNPPQGEVCVSGPMVTKGYYKNPEKTQEVFVVEEDGERWFHTGDVGQWNKDGTLSIIGRVKDIFKLDGGEYVAPERLETIYAQSPLLSNIFVYGKSDQSYLVAIVIPDSGAARAWASKNNVKYSETPEPNVPQEICDNKDFQKAVQQSLDAVAGEAKLNRYEYVPKIHLDGRFWSPDTGLVTDALKNKRDPLYDHYAKEIEALYK